MNGGIHYNVRLVIPCYPQSRVRRVFALAWHLVGAETCFCVQSCGCGMKLLANQSMNNVDCAELHKFTLGYSGQRFHSLLLRHCSSSNIPFLGELANQTFSQSSSTIHRFPVAKVPWREQQHRNLQHFKMGETAWKALTG